MSSILRTAKPLLVLLTAAAVLVGCKDAGAPPQATVMIKGNAETRRPPGRVVLFGIDALGPDLLDEVVAAGKVPTFAKLFECAAVGTLDVRPTRVPPLSPRIWASISTGVAPEQHGIVDWADILPDGRVQLFSSGDRDVPAIWNIVSAFDRRVGVVNWLMTYPAEVVNGFVVSDRYDLMWAQREAQQSNVEVRRDVSRAVFPASLIPAIGRIKGLKPPSVPIPADYEAIDREILRMSLASLRVMPVDVALIYMRAFDEICHTGWYSHEPPPGGERAEGPDVVVDYLERFDWIAAELFATLGPNDHLIIVSDHGFEPNEDEVVEKGTHLQGVHESDHTATALFIAAGPRIREGVRVGMASVFDVLPTVLELAGLPSARDLPGKIFAEAFKPEERNFLPPVDSYQQVWTSAGDREVSEADAAIMERLRSLGYIDEKGH